MVTDDDEEDGPDEILFFTCEDCGLEDQGAWYDDGWNPPDGWVGDIDVDEDGEVQDYELWCPVCYTALQDETD